MGGAVMTGPSSLVHRRWSVAVIHRLSGGATMTTRRQERVSELLREELSLLIGAELTDPRLEDALVNVTDVIVSPDLQNARVYIEHSLPHTQDRQVLSALQHSATFLRRALIENLNLRVVPELHFTVDTAAERGQRIDALLESITREAPAAPQQDA